MFLCKGSVPVYPEALADAASLGSAAPADARSWPRWNLPSFLVRGIGWERRGAPLTWLGPTRPLPLVCSGVRRNSDRSFGESNGELKEPAHTDRGTELRRAASTVPGACLRLCCPCIQSGPQVMTSWEPMCHAGEKQERAPSWSPHFWLPRLPWTPESEQEQNRRPLRPPALLARRQDRGRQQRDPL